MTSNPLYRRTWVKVIGGIASVVLLIVASFMVGEFYAVYKVASVMQKFPSTLCVIDGYGRSLKGLEDKGLLGENTTRALKAYLENRCYEEFAIDPSINRTWVGTPLS